MGNSKFADRRRDSAASGVSSNGCVENKDFKLAPRVGLEPTTLRLTAECSTIELPRNNTGRLFHYTKPTSPLSINLYLIPAPPAADTRRFSSANLRESAKRCPDPPYPPAPPHDAEHSKECAAPRPSAPPPRCPPARTSAPPP